MLSVPESGGEMVCSQNCDLPLAYGANQLLHPSRLPQGEIQIQIQQTLIEHLLG